MGACEPGRGTPRPGFLSSARAGITVVEIRDLRVGLRLITVTAWGRVARARSWQGPLACRRFGLTFAVFIIGVRIQRIQGLLVFFGVSLVCFVVGIERDACLVQIHDLLVVNAHEGFRKIVVQTKVIREI